MRKRDKQQRELITRIETDYSSTQCITKSKNEPKKKIPSACRLQENHLFAIFASDTQVSMVYRAEPAVLLPNTHHYHQIVAISHLVAPHH
jgi:hypothetical protein